MKIIWTRSNTLLSRIIRRITGEDVSHVVIETDGYVIHSNLLGVHPQDADLFFMHAEAVYTLTVPSDYQKIFDLLCRRWRAWYDFGAMIYLGFRCLIPWLPKANLWQSSGMYLCTEFVTEYIDGTADSMITPKNLYLRLTSELEAKDSR